jgi:hypothetical protein
MKSLLTAIFLCALCALAAAAQGSVQTSAKGSQPAAPVPTVKPAAAAPTPATRASSSSSSPTQTDAYKEWERQHNEWKKNYSAWENRYNKWVEEQARLDDGFLLSIGLGPSPTRVDTRFSGGDTKNFPDRPPFPDVNFRGMGASLDFRFGWLVENDPYLKDYWYGNDELHDQLYLTLDLLTRSTTYPQLRFEENDTANTGTFFQPVYMLDLVVGVGMTYLIYPYRTSISPTVGFGLLGIQGKDQSVRTEIGPAFNLRIGQEWALRENWRTGFAVNYGYVQSINPRKVSEIEESYQENYSSHLFSIQWINSFTPPKYRRGIPPARPQQYNPTAPAR